MRRRFLGMPPRLFPLIAGILAGFIPGPELQLAAQPKNPAGPTLANPPANTLLQTGAKAAQDQDLFNHLVASSASIDMDLPVTVKAEFDPPTVPLGGRAVYRIVLTALNESVKLPETLPTPDGLRLVPGGRAQTFQPLNALRLQPQTTIQFRSIVRSNGVYTMPSFPVTAYGKSIQVPEATLTVVAPGTPNAREAPRLIVELPDGDVYVGQMLKVRVILLDPGDGTSHGLSQPQINGESLFLEPISFGQRRETLRRDGKSYPAFVQDLIVTPMREGTQTLVAQGQAIFSRMLQGQAGSFHTSTTLVDSDPLPLLVKPLPKEGQLPGFTGAIGSFQVESPKLSTNQIRAGDPLVLTVNVRGDGNIGRMTAPQIGFLREWQTFPPVADSGPPYVIQQRGFATFSYTLIPLTDRTKTTPAIPFSYFDPKKGAYGDLTIPPVPVTITPAPAGTATLAPASAPSHLNADPEDSPNRDRDPVMTGLAETPGKTMSSFVPLQEQPWFLLLQLAPALALGGLWAWDRRRRHLEAHPEIIRKRRARRGVRRQMRLARKAAAARDTAGFASGAVNALREACAPHGGALPEALVCADVLRELPATESQGRTGEVIRRLFTAADALRFGGPAREPSDLLTLKPEFERLVTQLRSRL